MQKAKPILLLSLLFILIFPWRLICLAHPLGHSHEHHEPGKLTPCQIHAQYDGSYDAFLPPMHCHWYSADVDDYDAPDKFQIKPPQQTLAVIAVVFEIVKIDIPEKPFLFPPQPQCRSATLISGNSLRAPPLS